jgi:hypothetical protein
LEDFPNLGGYQIGAPPKEEYTRYHRELEAWKRVVQLLCPCQLQLANTGTSEATDIEVVFSPPSFVTAIRDDDVLNEPEPPRSLFDSYAGFGHIESLTSHLGPRPVTRPYVSAAGVLSFRIPALVHNRTLSLDQFYFQFPRQDAIKNFSVAFSMTYREALDPITSNLNITIK